ncbi:hypothetical protein [Nitrosomonas oligotropha]|uniref:YbgF trimerisation domain-containing protein n=1 Tax=Nitrosomonas oligotropha TaxID=42354 RepID=A0A1H8J7I9_9PROT|nr:hypothetical protein [Nitrosomonas oligotropha]SDW06866.1 hypothetical protein SAMN05216300_101176 [Nitrosomonas oligotropha]SEN76744.1 hypothetical protein SAMN05216333_101124 [Nitrosomonas oligotropha]
MRTTLFLLALTFSLMAWADEDKGMTDTEKQSRQLEKALARIQQESQSIQQQFMMIQELRRNDIAEPSMNIPLPSTPGQSIPVPNYNNLMQQKQERDQRIEKYTADLNRLYARFTELENEKQVILEQIKSLEQKTEE